ncbi:MULTISPECIES: hypothetical protein [Alkalibacterium]|uniref:Uncharacterized protein n=1 Tax=Alkalibacterium thalassium TaxID=426701 RepID=A0A1G9FTM6_9LACT|nr:MULTISPECIES: hypothetical protein [Alkalibacterium]SDK91695.1 hypothetical protein SAMN04488098_10872 [Alkalibacterium thalassium]
MYTIEFLLEKYRNKIIMVDHKKNPFDVLKDLVDIKEIDLNLLHPVQLELIEQNVNNTKRYGDTPIKLHFYEILKNIKSEAYYNEIENTQSMSHIPYFNEPTVFVIHEDYLGLQETNSNSLYRDCIISRGVTQKDIEEKNDYLFNYLSYISAWEEETI